MITFLHDKLKSLLLILLGIVGISFIFFGNWTPHGGDPASAKVGQISGRKLTLNDFIAAQRLTILDMTLQTGRIPSAEQGTFINLQTWLRLLQLQAANSARLDTQPDQLVEAIKENPFFRKDNQYDPELFQRFSANFLSPQGFTGERFNQAVADQVRIRQLLNALSSTAILLPKEAETRLQKLFGPVEAQVIRWDASKLNSPEPTQMDLESFFKANEAEFAVAPRRTVDVVEITATGSTEEAKKQAGEAAFAFTSQFFNLPEGKSRPDFSSAAAQAKLSMRTLGPFTPKDNPFPGENDPRLVMAAFSLTSADPVSDFLPSKNGYLVLHLREEQPGRSRALAEITPEVRSRWQEQARLQMVAQQAKNFADRANAALAAGQKWEEITKAYSLSPEKLPVFAPADEKPLTFPDADRIRPAVTQLEPNRVGGFTRTANGGLSVFLAKREPAPASTVGTTLPKISSQLLNQRRGQIIRDWLSGAASQPGNELPQEVIYQLRGAL
ncbi:MAG: hypothetical protein EB090_02695 [Verrucomicrobia bacterium]|nr:hypothetical protein [Verrucomicrobiota bacterium]